ncbi:MAG: ribonuclease P protein component [Patescibacteria group bacterium]
MLPRNLQVNFRDTKRAWRIFRKTSEFLVKTRPSLSPSFAVTISVKVAKKSSRRNLLKRRAKGIFLKNLTRFKAAGNQDYWVKLFTPANNLSKKEFETRLADILLNKY